ncbi:MAG: DNA polymerase III subunit chi [Rhodocyclales bacterium]|nr:DNA polymerase III subunit chi [Rhodocyclales bacterium]
MTRISFLHGASDRLQATASWLLQASREGQRIVVYVPSVEDRNRLDRLLWINPATGFVPHCQAGSGLEEETPVVLASGLDQTPHDEWLLNLSNDVPPGFGRFEHLVEIVSTANEDKLPGRERFRFYRERGYPLEARDISGEAA